MIVTGFGLVLIFLVWTGVIRQLQAEKKHTIDAAVQNNDNLVVALEQYAIRTIHNADALLQLVKNEYETKGQAIRLTEFLSDHYADMELFEQVTIIGADGNLIASNSQTGSGQNFNFRDREHFLYHLHQAHGSLFIGKPIVLRTLNKPVIPFSRRINKADGSFGGIVAVHISPSTLTHLYANANLRPDDIISLVALDGTTYARRTGARESFGENISKSPLYHYVSERPAGNYFAKDALRGIPSFFSYRKLEGYDMIATVGISEQDVLSSIAFYETRDRLAAAFLSGLILLFCFFVNRMLAVRKRNLEKVQENEEKYRSLFENTQEAILLTDSQGAIIAANPAACRFFKMPGAQLCQTNFWQLMDYEGKEDFGRPEQMTEGHRKEAQFVRSNGSRFAGEMTMGHHNNAAGEKQYIIIVRDVTLHKKLAERRRAEEKRYQRQITEQVILAQEREREFVGRELHDNVNQVLTTIKLYLEMALTHKELREELLPKSIHHVKQSIHEIRKLSRELSAPTLNTQSLVDSVATLLETIQTSSKLHIVFDHSSYQEPLTKEEKLALYRIAQEQFTNIIKHARASTVEVCLGQTGEKSYLVIKDNGQGFDPQQQRTGIGINNMISRARVFEGVVTITSEPGKGTKLEVSLPLRTCDAREEAAPVEPEAKEGLQKA